MAEAKKTSTKAAPKATKKVEVKTQKDVTVSKFKASGLPKEVFGLELKESYSQSIFDTIMAERASKRQGTHKVKSRGEVSGTGKKPWRQKGTGKARTGSLRGPIFVGGGRAFGPTVERNYNLKVNKKVRLLALVASLTQLANNQQVLVEEVKLEKPSTKGLIQKLEELKANNLRNVVIVSSDENVFLSGRNLKNVSVVKVTSLSVEELVRADLLIIGSENVKYLEGLVK